MIITSCKKADKSYDIEVEGIGSVNIKVSLGAKYLHHLLNNQEATYSPTVLRNIVVNKMDLSPDNLTKAGFQNREELLIYTGLNSFIPATDTQTIIEVKRELNKVRKSLEEAKKNNDLGRVDILQTEEDALANYLYTTLNKNGTIKNLNNNHRKDIKSITRAIDSALQEIRKESEEIASIIDQIIIRNSNQVRVELDKLRKRELDLAENFNSLDSSKSPTTNLEAKRPPRNEL